jgi:putative oxidoreductase
MSRLARADRIPDIDPPADPVARMRLAGTAYAILRVGTGLLFLCHGLQKLFGLFGGPLAPLASRMGFAGVLELVGGLLLVLGVFTRPVAAVLALEMAAAYVIAHLPRGPWPLENGGEVAALYFLIFLFLALTPRTRR